MNFIRKLKCEEPYITAVVKLKDIIYRRNYESENCGKCITIKQIVN